MTETPQTAALRQKTLWRRFVLLDEKFAGNKLRYLLQCLLATAALFVVLLLLDVFSSAATVAALGASSFIAFTMPHAQVSRPRFLIGGYIAGVASGCACRALASLSWVQSQVSLPIDPYLFFCALAVGLAIFIMVITNTEHPPAAGLALGLMLGDCSSRTIIVVLLGISSLSVLKTLLKSKLISLL